MKALKIQVDNEAHQLSMALYNLNLEKDRIEKRLIELAVASSTIAAIEKEELESANNGEEE